MAATKTLRTLTAAGTNNTAGSTETGTTVDLRTAYGGLLTGKITNGATGPTIAASMYVDVSGDGTNWKDFRQFLAGTANNGVAAFSVEIPPGVMYVRTRFKDNTGQTVVVEAFLQELTTI